MSTSFWSVATLWSNDGDWSSSLVGNEASWKPSSNGEDLLAAYAEALSVGAVVEYVRVCATCKQAMLAMLAICCGKISSIPRIESSYARWEGKV